MQSALFALAVLVASQHGLNTSHFVKVIECESAWDTHAVGDRNHSFGLVQIYLPAHPEVSRKEAEDPQFAIEWMAEQWENDRAYMWSCWKNLYGSPV